MVIWIIGLSGSGKTTLSQKVVAEARKRGRKVVLLDGDQVRDLFRNDLGHSVSDRRVNADRICRLCGFLDNQEIDVVCAILSLFPESRAWCRENLSSYYEVFIDAPLDQLIERDDKGIYGRFQRGEISDVAGLDLDFPQPKTADLVIMNNSSRQALLQHVDLIVDHLCEQP